MLGRAGAVWFGIMLLAILNGAARDIVLVPRLGDAVARAVSCVTLASAILLVAWLWILVLAATVTAPVVAYCAGHNPVRGVEISSPVSDDTPRR